MKLLKLWLIYDVRARKLLLENEILRIQDEAFFLKRLHKISLKITKRKIPGILWHE